MMLTNLSKREKHLAAVTLCIVLGSFFYRYAMHPRIEKLRELDILVSEETLNILQMERALALSERIETRYEAFGAAIAQKGSDLEESIDFLRTVSDLTAANEMKISMQEQLPVELGKYYKIFSVRLGVQTRPVWLARFLASLDKSSQIVRVEDIKVTALDESENLAINMKLTKVIAAEGAPK